MKQLFISVLLYCALPCTTYANTPPSPIRYEHESYEQAKNRAISDSIKSIVPNHNHVDYPFERRLPFHLIDFSKVPKLKSYNDAQTLFDLIRDQRFLSRYDPHFLRRVPWLYPDNGCAERAALASVLANDHKLPRPAKIYAFGDLEVQTPNHPDGAVRWWYHVSLIVSVNDSYYVLDPAINPYQPMLAIDWFKSMTVKSNYIRGIVCSPRNYLPSHSCMHPPKGDDDMGINRSYEFLHYEYKRVKALGYNPIDVLGDTPPWLG